MTAVALRLIGTFVGLILLGNLVIMAASWVTRATTATPEAASVEGIDNLAAVDDRVWRGAAPTSAGYRGLAESGVSTVVDLRAEDGVEENAQQVEALGMRYVHLPIRDGQIPKADQVNVFLQSVNEAPGRVFVHCGAGVGRTGAMAGAYLVAQGEGSHTTALRRNLAVGPPSLEQIAYVNSLDGDGVERPSKVLTMASRVLDFPRRAWHVIGG